MPRLSDLNASQLMAKWIEIVNSNTSRSRDSHLLTQALITKSPIQLLLGMYQYQGNPTITIPAFLRREDDWIEDNERIARVELATYIEHVVPTDYYIWKELLEEENAESFQMSREAFSRLDIWARQVIL